MLKNHKSLIIVIIISLVSIFLVLEVFAEETNKSKLVNSKDLKLPEIAGLQGGYLPKCKIIIGDYELDDIQIYADDKKVEEILFEIKDKNKIRTFPCMDFTVELNKLIIKPTSTIIGDISFEGIFLPVKNGNYMGLYDTVVLRGKLMITKDKKNLYLNDKQEFTFLYGD